MTSPSPPDVSDASPLAYARGVVGMVLGASIGCVVFALLLRAGFYSVMLVGLCTGWGCAALSKASSRWLGVGCVVIALPVTVGVSWYFGPFRADGSLLFYVQNLHQLSAVQLIMMVLGLAMAFYVGKGRG